MSKSGAIPIPGHIIEDDYLTTESRTLTPGYGSAPSKSVWNEGTLAEYLANCPKEDEQPHIETFDMEPLPEIEVLTSFSVPARVKSSRKKSPSGFI